MNLSFQDSTYSASNKPSTATLKTDLQTIETDFNAHESDTSTHGVSGAIVGTTDTQTLTNKTLSTPVIKTWDGWNTVSDTWSYASATTITVPSGAASLYQKGDKFKLTANSVVLQGYIVTVADTLLTVKGDSLTNHAFSAIAYSHIDNPIGFPHSFAYTPTGPTNTTLSGKFSITGGKCFVTIAGTLTGVPVWTNMPTLPVAVSSSYYANGSDASPSGIGGYLDSGTANKTDGITPVLQSSDTNVRLNSTANSSIVTATNPITWATNDTWIVRLNYEI